jgi:ATP-dependent DNA ligase
VAAALAAQIPELTVIDGELVAWRDGRLDFTALQPRLHSPHRAAPAHLIVFDVLAERGEDHLRYLPYTRGRGITGAGGKGSAALNQGAGIVDLAVI